jgi:hypothetical protein
MIRRLVIASFPPGFVAAVLVPFLVAAVVVWPVPASGQVDEFETYSARGELAEPHADVFRLYWAFFDRRPDVAGARYWVDQYDRCASLLDITWSFANSTEFGRRYGNLTDGDYVDLVYANVLDRGPDPEGRRYWLGLLDSGELIRSEVMLYFSLGPEFRKRHPLPSDGRAYAGCREPGSPTPVIGPGTYLVGSEVPAGVYRVARYWATFDADREILANDLVADGVSLAVIPSSAAFVQFAGEAVALRDRPVVDPIADGHTDGTYLVGPDLAPGRYRVTRSDGLAYGARLDTTLDIIDNDLNPGSIILTVQPTDYAVTFAGRLERIG